MIHCVTVVAVLKKKQWVPVHWYLKMKSPHQRQTDALLLIPEWGTVVVKRDYTSPCLMFGIASRYYT